jgi:hypothetical protein
VKQKPFFLNAAWYLGWDWILEQKDAWRKPAEMQKKPIARCPQIYIPLSTNACDHVRENNSTQGRSKIVSK